MQDPCFMSATTIADEIRSGGLSPVSVVSAFLERIRDDDTNAYITVLEEPALEEARAAERAVADGSAVGPLHGVPIAIKDLFAYKAGARHTFGSTAFTDYVPDSDSTVVARLERAGAIILGKTNTPPFGNRALTDNDIVGTTTSPVASGRIAGGTSGGSAAAVAGGLAAMAHGEDSGGSIRIPAACCHVFGFKPSFGRVPNGPGPGAFGAHTPFTQHGPITRSVADAALFLDVVTGADTNDPFSLPGSNGHRSAVEASIDGVSVAYSPDLGLFTVDPAVEAVVDNGVKTLVEAGASVDRVRPDYGVDGAVIRDAWRSMFQSLIAGITVHVEHETGRDPLTVESDPLFQRVAREGMDRSLRDMKRAEQVRTRVYDAIQSVFADYDLIVSPTLAVPPFEPAGHGPSEINGTETDPHIDWMLTWPFNMTPHPASSVPAGTTDGLPVSMQIVGHRFADDTVLAASAAVERARPWEAVYPGR